MESPSSVCGGKRGAQLAHRQRAAQGHVEPAFIGEVSRAGFDPVTATATPGRAKIEIEFAIHHHISLQKSHPGTSDELIPGYREQKQELSLT
jgi:hypothetical protein